MQFKPNYPIYLQVSDFVCEKVLKGEWVNGEKLPSVKELSVMASVNPNTIVKSLSYLQDQGVLASQRGIGYFLTPNARSLIIALKKRQFVQEALPTMFDTMHLLGMTMNEVSQQYTDYAKDKAND